ncbi:MAG: HAMP domain-containing protein [Planctomycetes bacterium]|nr:HAMP domain-containing protein [Planctomycetota bacterium]
MTGSWRIGHKLMLGMGLVVAIMALLLGGTLYGLASYRAAMGTCVRKMEEMRYAETVKEEIRKLRLPAGEWALQERHIFKQIENVEKALEQYAVELQETIDRGRAPNEGRQEQALVAILQKDMKELRAELKKVTDVVGAAEGHPGDFLDGRPILRRKLEDAETHVSDLIGTITKVISTRIDITRDDARKSIILLSITGILAILLMAGNLRFFYRWVAEPIRDLEEGVSRVAQGDFDHRIEINSGDEIEDLAKAYNDMAAKLREMYDSLAQQVNERSRQLVRSERLAGVGFLAAGVAHEINNPLASIAFCSEALESRLDSLLKDVPMSDVNRQTIAKYLKMIQEEAFRCKEITQKLLAFSRGGDLKCDQTNLVDVIQGVIDMVQHLQNCKGKRIEFRPLGPIIAWVNAQEIKQVFLNLVVNALENMDDGGLLTITHGVRDGQIVLVFKDTGCGMTPDVLENIFEPFFTRSKTGKGTGLGLSISHRIITQHGGEIEATSGGSNQGSTFTVHLPIHPPSDVLTPGNDVQDPVEEFLKLSAQQKTSKAA